MHCIPTLIPCHLVAACLLYINSAQPQAALVNNEQFTISSNTLSIYQAYHGVTSNQIDIEQHFLLCRHPSDPVTALNMFVEYPDLSLKRNNTSSTDLTINHISTANTPETQTAMEPSTIMLLAILLAFCIPSNNTKPM